jgi:exodeoxyribonuclease VII small subunit
LNKKGGTLSESIMIEEEKKATFEEALAELEAIVRELEDGKTGLEESLARYEAGVALLKRCYAQLARAEQRIMLVTGEDGEGNPVLAPFDHSSSMDGALSVPDSMRAGAEMEGSRRARAKMPPENLF